jgi:glycosyltransferase involved in cell wall biosynthesis
VRKTVLVLNHFAVPPEGAGGTRHVELFERLQPEWEYILLAADRNLLTGKRDRKSGGSFRVIVTTPYKGNGASRILNWVSYAIGATVYGLSVKSPSVVFASSPHLLTGLAGFVVARLRRAGFILEIRDLWPRVLVDMGRMQPTSIVYRLLSRLERFLYRKADEIVVLAEGTARAIRDNCPEVRAITFIPNGSDPAMMETSRPRSELRSRYGIGGLALVYAGAHGPANGLHLVLDAAEILQREGSPAQFILVGDGVEKSALVKRAQDQHLTNVLFLDPVPKEEIGQVLAAADIGLHVLADVPLFRYGVSPNKLFDYMAAGLPVLTNCAGEVAALITESGAGVAVAAGEIASGVRTMDHAGEPAREGWGAAGKRYIEKHRSRGVLAAQIAAVLDRNAR